MFTSKRSLQGRASGRTRKDPRPAVALEPLEARALLSGWSTSDDFQLVPMGVARAEAMTSDAAGNVYALGTAQDYSGTYHTIRMKAAQSAGWATIFTGGNSGQTWKDIAVNPAGDIYVVSDDLNGGISEMKRSAGETSFSVIDQKALFKVEALACDANGDVYEVGANRAPKPNGVYAWTWGIRKQTGGVGAFRDVDAFSTSAVPNTEAQAITFVPTGNAAGMYVVGAAPLGFGAKIAYWYVRRSTDGGNTWSTVDTYQYDTLNNGGMLPAAVAGDANGNVYVAGLTSTTSGQKFHLTTTSRWLTRKGVANAAGGLTWSNDDVNIIQSASNGYGLGPTDMVVDGAGTPFVVGTIGETAADGTVSSHGVVRSKVGATWQTVDDFQLRPGSSTELAGAAIDAGGTVFAGGYSYDPVTQYHWIVRASPAPTSVALTTTSTSTFSTTPISGGTLQVDPAIDLSSSGALLA